MIPAALRRNALIVWGADGAAWLDRLPALIDTLTADWDLDIGEPFVLSYHWVAPAVRADGTAVVVKLGVPGRGHLVVEAAALREYDGQGAVRLLAFDEPAGRCSWNEPTPVRRPARSCPAMTRGRPMPPSR